MKAVLRKRNNFGLQPNAWGRINTQELWRLLDTNGDGKISVLEYMSAGGGRGRAGQAHVASGFINKEIRKIRVLLKKCFEKAEVTKGKKTGAYITPQRLFTADQLRTSISMDDVTSALGSLRTFSPNTAKGFPNAISIPDVWRNISQHLDSSANVAVGTFIEVCDPLELVSHALNQ